MALVLRGSGKKKTYHLYMRVPARFRSVETRANVYRSLRTDSIDVAKKKEPDAKRLFFSVWEAKLAGRDQDAISYQKKLSEICDAYGFEYLPAIDVSKLPFDRLKDRIHALDVDQDASIDALLGTDAAPRLLMSGLFDEYKSLNAAELLEKSPGQIRKWNSDRNRAINNFIQAVGDVDISALDLADVNKFRKSLSDKIEAGGIGAESANREIYTLGAMVKMVSKMVLGKEITVFSGMLFGTKKTKRRNRQVSFSSDWITAKFLGAGAFMGLNPDARDLFLAMINTGLRPSELAGLDGYTINLSANVPHVIVRGDGRELKTVWAERAVPLSGASLEAVRRHPEGFQRYANAYSWSGLMAKYLKAHGLLETAEHRAYSLRHSFSDRLKAVGCPDTIRQEMMGHKISGTDYGEGLSLEGKQEWISKIAL